LPQEFYIFALSLLTIAMGVVMFTAIFGRVWCGWACPQTIFMEMVFRKIEYLIEGNSNKQRALERQEWDGEKIFKKLFKWTIFYALSFVIGNLLLSYIIGVDQLFKIISDPIGMHIGGLTTMIIFSFVFFGVFTWFREQACTYVCPYGRLQSVLLDANTIVVAYDNKRGEPRAKFRKKDRDPNAGDCIECNKCIQACPTGIDIKDGTQLECINCTACMDACDAVMEQIGKPKGLIRYTSLNNIQEGKKFKWTPRLYFYSTILTILTVLVFSLLLLRKDIDATILRAKGAICTVLPNGNIANMYTFKIINKSSKDMELTLKSTRYNAKFTYIGADKLIAPANQIITGTFLMEIPAEKLMLEKNNIEIDVYSGDKKVNSKSSIFIVPEKTKKEIK
jgi:cytochrome c oxidase accessory protein FixG